MSVMSSLRRPLFTKGASGKKYPTEAVVKARAKDITQSEWFKGVLKRQERKRRDDELIALAERKMKARGKKLKAA